MPRCQAPPCLRASLSRRLTQSVPRRFGARCFGALVAFSAVELKELMVSEVVYQTYGEILD